MTEIDPTNVPWETSRWTPLERGARWEPGMRADYIAVVGTPSEIAANMTQDPDGQVGRTILSSGFVAQSPREFARSAVALVSDEDERNPSTLAAVVWDAWPTNRWDGERNNPRNPDHALDVYTTPAGGDVGAALRIALLTRLRINRLEELRRDSVVRLWVATRNISQVHQVTGVARSTIYRLLRAEGYDPAVE